MGQSLGLAVMLGWGLVSAVLFRRLGARRALLIVVIGGNLAIPLLVCDIVSGSRLQFTQPVAIGLAVALGVVVGERRRAWPVRVDWLDVPLLAYVAYPLSGLVTSGSSAGWDMADMVFQRGLGLLVPYAAARRYLGDVEGARQLAVTTVVATLAYLPVIVWEAILGPRWYLGTLLYGVPAQEGMVSRLGGWRPEGFFFNGLILATWMALAAVIAFWLWLWRLWRPRFGPAWGPALVLVLAAVGCRGVYGYITLGVGLALALLSRALRTRWAIGLLLLAAPLYIALRATGAWDARALERMAERTGRGGTVEFRLRAEDAISARVLQRHPGLGFGVELWHADRIGETVSYWPDGQWLLELWTGGLAGLALHQAVLTLIPAVLALALTRPGGGRGSGSSRADPRSAAAAAGASILGLALFTALCQLDNLHNHAYFLPRALVAGSLAGIAMNRRRGTAAPEPKPAPRAARDADRVGPGPARPVVDLSCVPLVTAAACGLYVFGHAPVAGHEAIRLVGGLGAALLFGAAGALGAWAADKAPVARLALFAGLFATFGVSFNLALHPGGRAHAAATADILQGLALCALAVACWRRTFGPALAPGVLLASLPLAAHLLLQGAAPRFPGAQYLFTGAGAEMSLFPLFPWLTMAAVGADAVARPRVAGWAAAALFALAAAVAWRLDPGPGRLTKFPMNLAYALLSCAAIEAAFHLARDFRRLGAAARGARWLGRHWLVYFYVHFAIAVILGRLRPGPGPAPLVWTLQAAGSVAATWLVVRAAAPWARLFQRPAAWLVPLALMLTAGVTPGLPVLAVSLLAGGAGLVFASYHETLAYLVFNFPSRAPGRSGPADRLAACAGGAVRLAIVALWLALPEIVGVFRHPAPVSAVTPPPSTTPAEHESPRPVPSEDRRGSVPEPPRGTSRGKTHHVGG